MRYKVYAILLLLALIFNICRFEIPYIQYDIFESYIAKNLCVNKDVPGSSCHGKCFLDKQIKITNETSDANQSNSNKKVQTNDVKEFLSTHTVVPKAIEITLTPLAHLETSITSRYISAIFIPPQL